MLGLTGWFGSLDLRKPYTSRILSHRIASRDPSRLIPLSTNTQDSLEPKVTKLKGVGVRWRGRARGQPMNDLVVGKGGLPRTKKLNQDRDHMDSHTRVGKIVETLSS